MRSLAAFRPEPVLQKMAEGCRASGGRSCAGWWPPLGPFSPVCWGGWGRAGARLPGSAGRGEVLLAEDRAAFSFYLPGMKAEQLHACESGEG